MHQGEGRLIARYDLVIDRLKNAAKRLVALCEIRLVTAICQAKKGIHQRSRSRSPDVGEEGHPTADRVHHTQNTTHAKHQR